MHGPSGDLQEIGKSRVLLRESVLTVYLGRLSLYVVKNRGRLGQWVMSRGAP